MKKRKPRNKKREIKVSQKLNCANKQFQKSWKIEKKVFGCVLF